MSLFSADGSECAVSDTSPLSNENNINNAETQEAQVVGEEEAEQLGKTVRDEGPAGLHVMLVELCNTMYGAMRPFLIHQTDLDTLCQTVGTLREELGTDEEFKDDDVGSNPGDDSAAITSSPDCAVRIILTRLVADAQERLIYCTLVLIREELEDFTPSASALDYPNRCRGPQLEATGDTGMTSRDTYMYSWYPTLRSCLVLLSKIYRAVDISVFQDLAGEAVSLCTTSLIRGASAITNKKGAEDGDLFLIRHLVLLRRELEPFTEVTDWGRLQRGLNFSSTRDALSNFLTRGSGHIFRFRGNSLLALAQQAVPLVDEEKVNSKNELEVQLKAAFSRFIARSVTALSGPLTDLTLKVEAVQAKTRAADQSKGGKGLHAALVALPFLRPDRLLETLTAAERNLALSLPRFLGRMSVYLESFSIRGLLFRPIQRKLLAVVVATQEIVETVVVRGQRDECSGDAETTDTVLNQVVPLRNLLSQMHSRVSKVDLNDSFEFEEELDNVVVDPSKALPPVSQKQEQKQMMDSPPAEKKRTTAPCHKKEGEEKPARTPLPLNGNAITTTTRNNATNGKSLSSLNGNTTSTSTAPSRGDVTAVKSDSTDETLPPFKGEARTTTTDATNKTSAAAAALNGTAERGGEEGGGVCDYRSQLVAFYKLYNPSKLDTVDSTLKKFAGREETLLKKLHDKYAPQAKAADAAPAPSGSTNKSVPQAKKDEPSVPPQDNMIDAGYRARMEAFYLEHNPEKVGTIDATLVKFSGREEVLIKKLHAKYKIPYKAPGVGQ
uniref:Conserved oligomeric Golgi complex subunit 3 C-terminal domain-containing protein n=1 Tax=Octactis speculum TaxID=3111310 RepID=A0A7S2G5Q8_9STRA